jgi:hypothetical protein
MKIGITRPDWVLGQRWGQRGANLSLFWGV